MDELNKNEILIAKLATQLYSSAPKPDNIEFGYRVPTVEACVEMAKKIIEASRLGLKPRERTQLTPRKRENRFAKSLVNRD